MAQGTIAGMLVQSGLQSADQAPDIGGAITKGAALAQQVEQTRQSREQLNMQKEEFELKKDERAISAIETGAKIKSPKMRQMYFKSALPQILKGLKRENMFSEQVREMFNSDLDTGLQKIQGLVRDVRLGNKTRAEVFATLQDPELYAMAEEYNKEFHDAEEAAQDYKERKDIAEIQAGLRQKADAPKILTGLVDDFNAAITKDKDKLGAAQGVKSLLSSKAPIAGEAAKRQIARLSGEVGVLTDADVAAWGGSKGWLDRAKQALVTAESGQITDENRAQLMQIANEFEKLTKKKIQIEADRYSDRGSEMGLDREKVRRAIGADKVVSVSHVFEPTEAQKAEFAKMSTKAQQRNAEALAKRFKMDVKEIMQRFKGE